MMGKDITSSLSLNVWMKKQFHRTTMGMMGQMIVKRKTMIAIQKRITRKMSRLRPWRRIPSRQGRSP
jgi:hypothetical protein